MKLEFKGKTVTHSPCDHFNYGRLFAKALFSSNEDHTGYFDDLFPKVNSWEELFNVMTPGQMFCFQHGCRVVHFRKPTYFVFAHRNETSLFLYNSEELALITKDGIVMLDSVLSVEQVIAIKENIFNRVLEIGPEKFDLNHYDYLEMMVPLFGKLLDIEYNTINLCQGFITAHGDKCYQYRNDWNRAGISFYRGALLYLLTYTKLLDREKWESCDWVIDNYLKLLPLIEKCEKALGLSSVGEMNK